MPMFLKLSLMAAVPVIFSVLMYLIDKKTGFSKLKYIYKQIIIGLVFGIIAICGTEFGVNVDGAIINVRNASPLCAGLIFGGPAGIISGLIGGTERFFAAFWGAGAYTQIACSITTVLAGILAAVARKFLFDNKKTSWFYGLVIAILIEVFDMLMIFLTNSSDVHNAFIIVRKCTFLMVSLNAFAVMFGILFVSFIGNYKKRRERHDMRRISQTFSRWLFVCVSVAFVITISFSMFLQSRLTQSDTLELLNLNIDDVKADISDASDENLLNLTKLVANDISGQEDVSKNYLNELKEKYDVAEINIIDKRGIVTLSTYEAFINYNMNGGEQSEEFLVLLDGETKEFVQEYGPTASDPGIMRKYAGVALDSGFVQVAYDAQRFQRDIDKQVIGITRNRHVGENGSIIIANEKWEIVSDRNDNEGENIGITGISIHTDNTAQEECFTAEVYGQQCYCMYVVSEGYYIIAVIPQDDVEFSKNLSIYITAFMLFVVFGALFILVYLLIKTLIVNNIRKINNSLAEITGGNLDVTVDVRSNEEFASLSDDINSTVVTLKGYIAEAAARIDKELEFAKTIQYSALPSVFPPYPNRTEFDIYASMITAKEVGGDFYDFYLLGESRLAFLIADVSGKGIPAAMFMMTSKTLIKSLAEAGNEINDVFTLANEKLCENNDAGMFVTAWMGILDLKTGHIDFANAGHNPPLIRRKDGSFEYLKCPAGFILAGMDGIKYGKNEIQLEPGDEIFLYTDGVTEATDVQKNAYGGDRLLRLLNVNKCVDSKSLCELVKNDIDRFAGDAPQFDDITMLSLKYNNKME
ncbi:MAG: SpoIIE family protein phosphatase [Ruminococcus sp.]